MPLPAGIEREVGTPGPASVAGLLDTFEETAELRWPLSTVVNDRMRRTDGQVASVLRAINLPIRGNTYRLAGDDVDERVMRFCEINLGLEDQRAGRRRRRREGVVFDELLAHALLMLPFGHSPLEQVYRIDGPPPGLEGQLPARLAHLRKLGPRLPRTLAGIDVADDGGLAAIRQQVTRSNGTYSEVRIPVDRLVMFVNEREGADWLGTSILRAAYKHWLIKDVLIRLGPLTVERNGMGIPTVYYSSGGDKDEALRIAREVRAGEDAGVALPEEYKFELTGVTGTTRDELPLLKYHDESIGRSVLAMFLNLGHDNGARSLGDTFVDYFVMALGAVVRNLAETITEHVIRDLVELNFGPDEPYPELEADELTGDGPLTAEGLKLLAEAGLLTPDPTLESELRRRHRLPAADPVEPAPEEDMPPGGPAPAPGEVLPGPEAVDDIDIEELDRRAAAVSARIAALRAARA
jgi:hypothetical protein